MKELSLDNIQPQSCDINDKGSSCCGASPAPVSEKADIKRHWNNAYSNSEENKLGWFETDLSPTLKLVERAITTKDARIINIGAGSTTLVDELLTQGYTNLIATDISEIALDNLSKRVGHKIETIIDDLINPSKLNIIEPVDLWIDRAVLHFFTSKSDQDTYFDLLKSKLRKDAYVILAQYNLAGASKCAGLPVCRYDKNMLAKRLGTDFNLIESFEYSYSMPSGDLRPYVYTLFQRVHN